VSGFYDGFARNYDWVTRWISRYHSPQLIASHLLPLVNESSRILDVGIGTGCSIAELIRLRKFSRVVGLDTSARMLERCHAKYPEIDLIHGEISNLGPEFDQVFDIVLSCGAVEHMSDFSGFLRHSHRLLRSGGDLLFTYEPVIDHSLVQINGAPHLGSFGTAQVFRQKPIEVGAQLQKNGFIVLKDISFRAYLWLKHRLILARKG
jgi:ubiquinone/menaquinone biosynthesis C-methylase UbiE